MFKDYCQYPVNFLLSVLFAFTLGLIAGALLAAIILGNLGAVIAVAVILALLLIIQLIRALCLRRAAQRCRSCAAINR